MFDARHLCITAYGDTLDEIEVDAFEKAKEVFGPNRSLRLRHDYEINECQNVKVTGKKFVARVVIDLLEDLPVEGTYTARTFRGRVFGNDRDELEACAIKRAREFFGTDCMLKVRPDYEAVLAEGIRESVSDGAVYVSTVTVVLIEDLPFRESSQE